MQDSSSFLKLPITLAKLITQYSTVKSTTLLQVGDESFAVSMALDKYSTISVDIGETAFADTESSKWKTTKEK
jgi:hypothetical protein